MFENIYPNMYDTDKFKGSTLEGKILRVVVSEVNVNVPQATILGFPWPEREVNLVDDKSAWEKMTWDSI